MNIGVSSSCLYPMLTERSVATLLNLGVRDLEVFFNTNSETDKKFVKQLKKIVNDYGGRVRSIHPYSSMMETFMFFSEYERRFTDMLETYQSYFDAANILGAEVVVIHGEKLPTRFPAEKYFERFGMIMDNGKKHGVMVAQENVNLHRSQDIDFLCNMRKWLGPNLKIAFDIKQAVRASFDPYDFADRLGDSICHVHINDNSPAGTCLLPGKGEMNYMRLISILKKNGCDPALIIEVYRQNYGDYRELVDAARWLSHTVSVPM